MTAVWFGWRSARPTLPLLELHLLRLPRFGVAGAGTFIFGSAFAIVLLSNVLWCQDVWRWSALRTGLALVPGPALVPIVAVRRRGRPGASAMVHWSRPGACCSQPAALAYGPGFGHPDYLRDLLPSIVLTGSG